MTVAETHVHDVYFQVDWVGVSLLLVFAAALAVTAVLIWRATRHRP